MLRSFFDPGYGNIMSCIPETHSWISLALANTRRDYRRFRAQSDRHQRTFRRLVRRFPFQAPQRQCRARRYGLEAPLASGGCIVRLRVGKVTRFPPPICASLAITPRARLLSLSSSTVHSIGSRCRLPAVCVSADLRFHTCASLVSLMSRPSSLSYACWSRGAPRTYCVAKGRL